MDARYHEQVTREALAPHFSPQAVDEVVRANLGQDALRYQLGAYPHFHFDNNRIAEGLAYVAMQHEDIIALTGAGTARACQDQRRALGRLLHAVQDFYAHANYVALWHKGHTTVDLPLPLPAAIDALDPAIHTHPELITGTFVWWRDLVYYVPVLGRLARRIWVHPTSHEGMNLDSPKSGPHFTYALEAARQRTQYETARALDAVRAARGPGALACFTATPSRFCP